MTDRQRLGQLIVCGVMGAEVDDDLRALVRERQIGNFILFARSVRDAAQLRALCADLRALTPTASAERVMTRRAMHTPRSVRRSRAASSRLSLPEPEAPMT